MSEENEKALKDAENTKNMQTVSTASKPVFARLVFITLASLILLSMGYSVWKSHHDNQVLNEPGVFIQFPDKKVLAQAPLQVATPNEVKTLSTDVLKKGWHLIYFGYTFCPDICPTELTTLSKVYETLKPRLSPDKLPTVVFISVDPNRDTPKKAMEYVKYFNPDFVGITGKASDLHQLGAPFGIDWHRERNSAIHGGNDDQNYLVAHSTTILLVDPKNVVRGMFPAPHDPDKMAKVIEIMVNH